MIHPLLQRQIRKICGAHHTIPDSLQPLLQAISEAYKGFYEDRDLIDRSLDLSSRELTDLNENLRHETDTLKIILNDLRSATAALRPSGYQISEWLTSKDEAKYLASSLTRLIYERKQTEEALKVRTLELEISKANIEQEKAKIETILQSIGDGVFVVDLAEKIILMNSVAVHLSGWAFDEAYGTQYKQIFQFILEKDENQPYPDFIAEVIKKGTVKTLANHTVLKRKDGTKIAISDSAAPLKDEKGKIFGCVVILRDVSRERELEKAKDNFISIAAHELRTPLGLMRWNIELMLMKKILSPDDTQNGLKKIHQNLLRMIDLVNDLLNVAKIDQGLARTKPELIDVVGLINMVIMDMSGMLTEKSVHIYFDHKQFSCQLYVDKKQFTEVIQNLLSNAIKYSYSNGQIVVTINHLNDNLRIAVVDQGIGIPVKDQNKVFSKFFRATNAIESKAEGSGLGLFVVKSYIESWGGRIWFESPWSKSPQSGMSPQSGSQTTPYAANGGTIFYIEIPCKKNNGQVNPDTIDQLHFEKETV